MELKKNGKMGWRRDKKYIQAQVNNVGMQEKPRLFRLTAIIHFQVVKIDYVSSEKKRTTRYIEPFAIYSIHGNFLLIAFCRLRNYFGFAKCCMPVPDIVA